VPPKTPTQPLPAFERICDPECALVYRASLELVMKTSVGRKNAMTQKKKRKELNSATPSSKSPFILH
jgi:hypothetical protein